MVLFFFNKMTMLKIVLSMNRVTVTSRVVVNNMTHIANRFTGR